VKMGTPTGQIEGNLQPRVQTTGERAIFSKTVSHSLTERSPCKRDPSHCEIHFETTYPPVQTVVLNRPSTTIFYLKCACICDRESPCVYIVCASTLDFEVMNFLLVYECVGLFLRDHAPRALFYAVSTIVLTINFSYFAPNLPLLSLHTHVQEGTPKRNTRKHQEFIFCDVPSRSKENVLGKDHLLQRNSTRIFY
jgi:hypothetical protein